MVNVKELADINNQLKDWFDQPTLVNFTYNWFITYFKHIRLLMEQLHNSKSFL